jgi:hypothetical protein
VLRQESANVDRDGKPIQERAEDLGTAKYSKGFRLLNNWIEQNLDIYKVKDDQCDLTTFLVDTSGSLSYGDSYGLFSSIPGSSLSSMVLLVMDRISSTSSKASLKDFMLMSFAFSKQSVYRSNSLTTQQRGSTAPTNIDCL